MTVVLATRNRPEAAMAALEAIRGALGPDDSLVVVDSASDDRCTIALAARAGVPVERANQPGVSHARNLGVSRASSEVVAFTDDDCRPRSGWIDALVRPFVDPTVGFTTGAVVGGSAADTRDLGPARWRWPVATNELGSGACMAFRRSALVAVGGFDERLGPGAPGPPGGEDQELFLRLLRAGWDGVFVPDATVLHDDRRSRLGTVQLFYRYGVGAGAIAAMVRHAEPGLHRRILARRLWTRGIAGAASDLARGNRLAAVGCVAMACGTFSGRVRYREWHARPVTPRPTAS